MKWFIFCVHNHQPVGNFDHVIRTAFEKSYKPFIDLVYELKWPKICFHFSGILYEWIERNFPHYIDKLAQMIERRQVEILGGGYYEPILSIIPPKDVVGQVDKLTNYIYKRFNFSVSGIWLTERIYNPKIIPYLVKCGINYIVVDDTHILSAGISSKNVNDIFITESDGYKMFVFPIDHNLRYLIPYQPPEKTVEYINSFDRGIFVMADDGEKFGLWPNSYKHVYEDGYLYRFFETIKNSNIDMKTFSQCLSQHSDRKKLVYIPTTSYFEMTEWALDADSSLEVEEFKKNTPKKYHRFIKGGIFENFFTKYPASNMIHKRVLNLSKEMEYNYNPLACDLLYKAECNCGWWHGVFGGIYLPHIRHAIYQNLLAAQKIIFSSKIPKVNIFDFDFDGKDEIVVETDTNYFIFSPSYGGSIVEFSSKNKCVNYSSVMSRFREAYHQKDSKSINGIETGISFGELYYDWHERRTLLDHFITKDTTLDMFSKARYPEQGDFIPQEYLFSYELDQNVRIKLLREGSVWYGDKRYPVRIIKDVYITKEDGFDVRYQIKNQSESGEYFFFLSEFVFGFSNQDIVGFGELFDVREVGFNDPVRGNIKMFFSTPVKLWRFPIMSCSNSEAGFEYTYQGSVVGCVIERYFGGNEEFCFDISVRVF